MNCPVCNKPLASTLSICFSCGAMVKDSVREELEVKSAPIVKPVNPERKGALPMPNKPNQIKLSELKPLPIKILTGELPKLKTDQPEVKAEQNIQPKSETPPSLVEFPSKNATLPDWRLKMQNAARQRIESHREPEQTAAPVLRRTQPVTSGANALKVEVFEETDPPIHQNATVSNALKRIEQSRQMFFVEEKPQIIEPETPEAQNKNYPFYIAARTAEPTVKTPEKASVNIAPKPKLVSATRNADGDLDTNKLPLLQPKPAQIATSFDKDLTIPIPTEIIAPKKELSPIIAETAEVTVAETAVETPEVIEETDDLAPFMMRFNAGVFDLIIGSFIGLILLAPFMLSGGNWFSFLGFLAFAAVTAVVMFIYMTTALGMFGRTLGMRMFSLELIDAEENDYPTFHQAAVNSSVYLLSLAFGGIGFLTIPFNEDKRAVHDIVSGTIVVKEE